VACNLGIKGVPVISSIDSDENGAYLTTGSVECMGDGLMWWQGGIRTDQDVSKIKWMLKTLSRFGGEY